MKPSAELEEKISRIENEISNLQDRRMNIDEELSGLKKDLGTNLDKAGAGQKIHELKSSRDTIDEVVEEKENTIEELEEQLNKANAQERKESQYERCVELAKTADKANQKYRKLVEELDSELMPKLIEIAKAKQEWLRAINEFKATAPKLEPALSNGRNEAEDMAVLEQRAKNFLQKIQEEANVDIEPVWTEVFVNYHQFRETINRSDNIKPDTDNFGHWIYEMLKKVQSQLQEDAEKARV